VLCGVHPGEEILGSLADDGASRIVKRYARRAAESGDQTAPPSIHWC
jgi:hypothetical protein